MSDAVRHPPKSVEADGATENVLKNIQSATIIAVIIIAINKAIACRACSGLLRIFSKEFHKFMEFLVPHLFYPPRSEDLSFL